LPLFLQQHKVDGDDKTDIEIGKIENTQMKGREEPRGRKVLMTIVKFHVMAMHFVRVVAQEQTHRK
jgi:hypothetical protein